MIKEFKTIYDLLMAFILRCKANDVIPCERHIEAYLSIVKAEKYNSIFIKYCFYYWDSKNVEQNLTKLLINGK